MSDEHSPEYYKKKFIPLIKLVGGILIAGTIITFAADKMCISEYLCVVNVIIFAMSVAVVKASAVIYIFMHLKWDIKLKTISLTLGCTVIFFIGMMWLTVYSEIDSNKPGGEENTWNHVDLLEPEIAPTGK